VVDVVSREKRSQMMAGVRSKNTSPELALRRGLHRRGFRFTLHRRDIPGAPDLVFRGRRAVLFAHGCFWHRHGCHLFKWPNTRREFWREKIEGNERRDAHVRERLEFEDWRVGVVWECALKGRTKRDLDEVVDEVTRWLCSEEPKLEIGGK
jgi:DNA mismatch endonuclease (patch repair protein)